jgi:integrase
VHGGRKIAERALAQLVAATPSRTTDSIGATLDRLLVDWLATARLEASTIASYTAALAHLPPKLRATRVDQLQLRTFDQLYSDLERQGIGAQQIRKLHTALSSALTEAVRWRWIEHHPARGARLPALPGRRVTIPDDLALDKILAAAADDELAGVWVRLALGTGARRGEVLALRWSDVKLAAAELRVGRSLNEDRSVKTTKTNMERTIHLDAGTVLALRSWRSAQAQRALAVGVVLVRDPFVLSNALDGSVPWRPAGASQRFRRLCARAGVTGVRLHDLRHAHASMLLGAGVDPVTTAERLGHARVSTTLDTYGHVLNGAAKAAADVVGRRLR